MGIHQERTHPEFVDGCFTCKVSTINVGTVPGGSKDARTNVGYGKQREKELTRYGEKRKAGERPSGTTQKAMDKDAYKQSLWEKHGRSIADDNPSHVVDQAKRSLAVPE
jgi:hypothetical protein